MKEGELVAELAAGPPLSRGIATTSGFSRLAQDASAPANESFSCDEEKPKA